MPLIYTRPGSYLFVNIPLINIDDQNASICLTRVPPPLSCCTDTIGFPGEWRIWMARGFSGGYRGGSGRRSSGTGARRGGSSGAGRRSSGSSSRARSKGQVKSGKTVQYAIKDRRGNSTYSGTTNNPRRRASEHRKSGKFGKGDQLVVETRAITRKSAERVEAAKLASHRRQHRRNPKHNTTRDGKYHQPRLI